MKISTRRICGASIAVIFALSPIAANAQAIQYRDSDNLNNVNVSVAQPLPVTVSGGGTGGGAVYGPNANGAAAAQPPVLIGGTADASATGIVQNAKVDSNGNVYTAQSSSVPVGALADSACATDTGTCSAIALIKRTNQNLSTLNSTAGGAVAAGTNRIGYVSDDPCTQLTKLGAPISLTASGQVITGTASTKIYICSIDLVSATAQNIALVEGTGSTCATNIFGLAGGTTAATGWNLAANAGLTKGSGNGTVYSPSADSNATAANVCLLLSSTGQTSGQITYVKQ